MITALNGFSIGGATEMVINCDMVVASSKAYLGLPDVKVGLTGLGGTFPRLVRRIGRSHATDMCLTGRNISAEEAFRWGLVDRVADEGQDVGQVALHLATQISANSPDAIIATRDGLRAGEDTLDSTAAGKEFIQNEELCFQLKSAVQCGNCLFSLRVRKLAPRPQPMSKEIQPIYASNTNNRESTKQTNAARHTQALKHRPREQGRTRGKGCSRGPIGSEERAGVEVCTVDQYGD